jgi:2-succinyl-5-enolpyruvyl-6-hydroxy-3-cyclohexene-1-carboxylate synthase
VSVPSVGDGGGPDVQAAFAATLVDEWFRGGVTHAVVCPGSRSTPLVVALAAHPELVVHVRLDERSAAFTAIGIGRATGRPALMVTTSGTAAAELHAAVAEADLGGVPLIACTADRPPELRDVDAPQTIEQARLFGRSVRWFCDPGVADSTSRGSWRSLASRSVAEAVSGPRGPGPVHLNLPFREPLLGDPTGAGGVTPGRPQGAPWHRVASGGHGAAGENGLGGLIEPGWLDPGRRGLIVAGAGCGEPSAVLALADSLGWPVLADPRSGVRLPLPGVVGAADGILRSGKFAAGHMPEVVLRLGERWASKVVNGFLSSAIDGGAVAIAVEPWGRWRDPEREVSLFIRSDPTLFCTEAAGQVSGSGSRTGSAESDQVSDWLSDWRAAESAARAALSAEVGTGSAEAPARTIDEPFLANRLVALMPAGSTLVVSSSMPVRDLESYSVPRRHGPNVVANRGVNGIDGVVSTALGVALASSGPTVALVGDLAFLHDVSALVHTAAFNAPLTVVVADNRGGGIFSFLGPATALDPDTFDTLFGTPQGVDVASVAAGFGWPVDDLGAESSPAEFEEVLGRRMGSGSMSVIRIRVPDRGENVEIHRRINAAIIEAVEQL